MPAVAIKTAYGADLKRCIAVYGENCDPETDVALFTIRDKTEKVFYWKVIAPEWNDELNAWTFNVHINHVKSEEIPKGSYKYGLTLYHDAEFVGDPVIEFTGKFEGSFMNILKKHFYGNLEANPIVIEGTTEASMPVVNGHPVVVLIDRKPYVVKEAVAREEGIIVR